MQHRTMGYALFCLVSGIALLLGVIRLCAGDWEQATASDGVRVVTGRPVEVSLTRREAASPTATPSLTKVTSEEASTHVKHFGEPPVATDALLDTATASAPDVIGVRLRLFAMQWPGGRDTAAEQALQARFASLTSGTPDRLRVHCSATTCEVATRDPVLVPRLNALVKPNSDDSVASCPLIAPEAVSDTWSHDGIAVAYVARGIC